MGYIYTKSGKLAKRLYFGAVLLFEGLYYTFKNRVLADGGVFVENELPTISQYASLVLTPNAYKAGKLYSAVPNDGTGDFTVDRNCTAKYTDEDGLIKTALANVPRIDYSSGEAVILRELQSTNLKPKSNDINDNIGGTVIFNHSISPSGDIDATYLKFGTNNNQGAGLEISTPVTQNTNYTLSFYAKKISGNGNINVRIDTNTTTLIFEETKVSTDNWKRFKSTFTTDANASSITNNSRFRNDNNNLGEVLIWGIQLEQGTEASSYIPTNGTTVTRLADDISVPTPAGVTSITETIDGVEQIPIATIPATYILPVGNINKVTMI